MIAKYTIKIYGWRIHRFLYDWVLSWAYSPLGGYALFTLALAESSFFPIPPDVLLIALVLSHREKAFFFAFLCSFASIIGGIFGYYIGYELWYSGEDFSSIANFFFSYIPGFSIENFLATKKWFEQFSFWIVFTAGFTPVPYKIITISAGVTKIDFIMFIIASMISRSLRFFIVAGLIWKFGEQVKNLIEKKFNIISVLLVLLFIGGFAIIKYIL